MDPLASNILDGGTVVSVVESIVLPGTLPGVVPSVVPNDVPGVVSTVSTGTLPDVEPGVVPKDVPGVVSPVVGGSLVVDGGYVVVVGDRVARLVGGHVAGGGSSHLSQMKNPILLFGPSVGSF